MDETMRYRAEQTLSNFDLNDDDLSSVIKEWTEHYFPEDCSPDFPIVILEQIAHRHLLKRKGLWEESRNYRIIYTLPREE